MSYILFNFSENGLGANGKYYYEITPLNKEALLTVVDFDDTKHEFGPYQSVNHAIFSANQIEETDCKLSDLKYLGSKFDVFYSVKSDYFTVEINVGPNGKLNLTIIQTGGDRSPILSSFDSQIAAVCEADLVLTHLENQFCGRNESLVGKVTTIYFVRAFDKETGEVLADVFAFKNAEKAAATAAKLNSLDEEGKIFAVQDIEVKYGEMWTRFETSRVRVKIEDR